MNDNRIAVSLLDARAAPALACFNVRLKIIERQNMDAERVVQLDEQHADRMEYAGKALALRGQYNPAVRAGATLNLGSDSKGTLEMGIAVYLPSNGRDDEDAIPQPRLPGEP